MSEIKKGLGSNPSTHITQELVNAAQRALRKIKEGSKAEIIYGFKTCLLLDDKDTEALINQVRENMEVTIENYPRLSYPIYIYYLTCYMLLGVQQNADHLDSSYYSDFQYLNYLNFCDRFIANETSTPYIVKALPYNDVRDIPIWTSEELKESLT